MELIRDKLEKRSISVMVLITLLCICVFAHAELTAGAILSILSGIGTVITFVGFLKSQLKSLEEKDADLKNDVLSLSHKKDKAWDKYEDLRDNYLYWMHKRMDAESTMKSAKSAEASAKSQYDGTGYYEKWYKKEFMDHLADCYYCDGISHCGDGNKLYNSWQRYKKMLKPDGDAWKTAKSQLSAANTKYIKAKQQEKWYRIAANLELSNFRSLKKKFDTKVEALKENGIKLAVKNASVSVALGRISDAQQELKDMRDKYPQAWKKLLDADQKLKKKVEEILNYETK